MTQSTRDDKNIWIWVAIPVAAVVLVFWWSMASQPVNSPDMGTASSTPTVKVGTQSAGSNKISSTVVGVAQGVASASVFASWLSSSGVASELNGSGPYTLFVPSDAAIGQLPKGTYNNLSTADKKRFVEYHIVVGRAVNVGAQLSGSIAAMSGDALNFSYANGVPMVGSATIIQQFKASNGVVYLINNGLVPPQKGRI